MMTEQLDPRLMLKQALVKEKMMAFEISTLEDNFYQIIREWLLTLSGEDRSAMQTLFNQLTQSRKNKITTLGVAVNTDPEIREKMTLEDMDYFDAVSNATLDFKRSVDVV